MMKKNQLSETEDSDIEEARATTPPSRRKFKPKMLSPIDIVTVEMDVEEDVQTVNTQSTVDDDVGMQFENAETDVDEFQNIVMNAGSDVKKVNRVSPRKLDVKENVYLNFKAKLVKVPAYFDEAKAKIAVANYPNHPFIHKYVKANTKTQLVGNPKVLILEEDDAAYIHDELVYTPECELLTMDQIETIVKKTKFNESEETIENKTGIQFLYVKNEFSKTFENYTKAKTAKGNIIEVKRVNNLKYDSPSFCFAAGAVPAHMEEFAVFFTSTFAQPYKLT